MSAHILDYTKAHMIERIMRCMAVRPHRARRFRSFLEGSPFCRLRQIEAKLFENI